jgi:hypothetical protein
MGKTEVEFSFEAECLYDSKYDAFIEISSNGHHTKGIIPIILLNTSGIVTPQ